jgi:hypothetical protein
MNFSAFSLRLKASTLYPKSESGRNIFRGYVRARGWDVGAMNWEQWIKAAKASWPLRFAGAAQ